MLVKYRGGQTALNLMVAGIALRLPNNEAVLVSPKQAKELKSSKYIDTLVKAEKFVFDDLSGYDKSGLESLAATHGIEVPAKANMKDIKALLVGEDESGTTEKPLEELSEQELSHYIVTNGGEHKEADSKDELLKIAGEIKASKG